MKLKLKIFRNNRNKSSLGRNRFQLGIYEGFKMFAIRLGNGIFQIAEFNYASEREKYCMALDYRQQSCAAFWNKNNSCQ
jgi:hypothetical protein